MDRETQKILSLLRIISEPSPCSTATFSRVAVGAGCHEISWRVITASHEWLNVVERQLIVGEYSRAVDATIGITAEDIRALVVSRL